MKTYRKLLPMKTLPVLFARIAAVAAPVVAGAVDRPHVPIGIHAAALNGDR